MNPSFYKIYFGLLLTLAVSFSSQAQTVRDNFDGPELDAQWHLPVGSPSARISLTSRPGYLRLKGSTVSLEDTEVAPVMVTKLVDIARFEATAPLDFWPVDAADTAGIDIRLGPRRHYEFGIRRAGRGREVYLRYVIGSVRKVAASTPIPDGAVKLKILAFSKYYRFAYATGENGLAYLGGVEALPQTPERLSIGLFASGNGKDSSANADFDRFEFDGDPPDPYANIVLTDPSLPKGYTIFSVDSAEKGIIEKYPFVTRPDPFVPSDIEALREISYAKYGDREMRLDLFRPRGRTPRPAVIIVHGGAWITGHHSMENPLALALARLGYVAATVEYRLSNEAKYPAQLHDLKASVRWLRANAKRFGIDQNRIGAVGASSGGHLVALLGSTNGLARFEGNGGSGKFSSVVQSVVDIDGTATFIDEGNIAKEIKGPWDTNTKLTGFTYAENPDIWKEASPITHVDRSSAPTLFLNSSSFRPFQQREEMSAKLVALGITSEVVVVPDTPHPFWLFRPWFDTAVENIDRFFRKTMSRR